MNNLFIKVLGKQKTNYTVGGTFEDLNVSTNFQPDNSFF